MKKPFKNPFRHHRAKNRNKPRGYSPTQIICVSFVIVIALGTLLLSLPIASRYGDYKHDHHFEGTLAYNFGENFPLTLSWSTMFAGGDDNKDGDRAYSTYINASYNIACPAEITLTPSVGFTPWKGMYDADGAAFTDIALKASKNINITDHFSLPLFVQAIVSPSFDKTYLIAGLSIGF